VWECILSLRALNTFSTTLSSVLARKESLCSTFCWTLSSACTQNRQTPESHPLSSVLKRNKTSQELPTLSISLLDPTQPADVSSKTQTPFQLSPRWCCRCPACPPKEPKREPFQTRSPRKHSCFTTNDFSHESVCQLSPPNNTASTSSCTTLEHTRGRVRGPQTATGIDKAQIFEGSKHRHIFFLLFYALFERR
jgi:hypothetical protein